jgi:hypothetical protein
LMSICQKLYQAARGARLGTAAAEQARMSGQMGLCNPAVLLNLVSLTESAQHFTSKLFEAIVNLMPQYESKIALFHFLSTYKLRALNDGLKDELWAGISGLVSDPAILSTALSRGHAVFHACVEAAVRNRLPTLPPPLGATGAAAVPMVIVPAAPTSPDDDDPDGSASSSPLLLPRLVKRLRPPATFLHLFARELTKNSDWVYACLHHLSTAKQAGTYTPPTTTMEIIGLSGELASLAAISSASASAAAAAAAAAVSAAPAAVDLSLPPGWHFLFKRVCQRLSKLCI